jgi:hypothetical protein
MLFTAVVAVKPTFTPIVEIAVAPRINLKVTEVLPSLATPF